jgi:hypothetical protein
MQGEKIVTHSLLHALMATGYVMLVSFIMQHADRLLGPDKTILAPVSVLMLFTLSAAVMASLVFGRPLMLYLDGKKKDAVKMAGGTIGFLALITLLIIAFSIAVRG